MMYWQTIPNVLTTSFTAAILLCNDNQARFQPAAPASCFLTADIIGCILPRQVGLTVCSSATHRTEVIGIGGLFSNPFFALVDLTTTLACKCQARLKAWMVFAPDVSILKAIDRLVDTNALILTSQRTEFGRIKTATVWRKVLSTLLTRLGLLTTAAVHARFSFQVTKQKPHVQPPFMGIGSVAVQALKMKRNAFGTELNSEYWQDSLLHVLGAEAALRSLTLFDYCV